MRQLILVGQINIITMTIKCKYEKLMKFDNEMPYYYNILAVFFRTWRHVVYSQQEILPSLASKKLQDASTVDT